MTTMLEIYQSLSGQWNGIMHRDGEEIGRIAGCKTAEEVKEEAENQGFEFQKIMLISKI